MFKWLAAVADLLVLWLVYVFTVPYYRLMTIRHRVKCAQAQRKIDAIMLRNAAYSREIEERLAARRDRAHE